MACFAGGINMATLRQAIDELERSGQVRVDRNEQGNVTTVYYTPAA